MKKKIIKFKSGEHTLYGVFETPKKNNGIPILLLHGLTNSMKDCPLINEATIALHKKGFPTFNFDYYGSGKSEGIYSDKTFSVLHQNTVDALGYVINKLKFKKIGLWGRSLGGILASTVSDGPHIFASVIISSTIHTNKTFKFCFNEGEPFSIPMKGTGVIKGKPVLSYKFYEETKWIDKLQKEHLSKSENILVMQGTEDKTIVDMNYAKEIFNLIKGKKKLEYIKGATHAYKGFEKIVVDKGVDWFIKNSL